MMVATRLKASFERRTPVANELTLTILGSCSGTEPMPGRHQTSTVMEFAGRTYFFDAGENCAHAAYTGGINLPALEAIFISHTHFDHIGGLPHLFWTLGKISGRSDDVLRRLSGRTIEVFIPDPKPWNAITRFLGSETDELGKSYRIISRQYDDGVIFDRHGVKITALHNRHLGDGEPHRSFSFRVDAGGKAFVYSGDVKHISELVPILPGADVILMESGHHRIEEVCTWVENSAPDLERLVFVHHGREILRDPDGSLEKVRAILGERVSISNDGTRVEI